MEKLVLGMQVIGNVVDMGMVYGLGLPSGNWQFSEEEALPFARIIARRADEGHIQAIETMEKLINAADYIAAVNVVIEKTGTTVKEITTYGIKPFGFAVSAAGKNGGNRGRSSGTGNSGNRQAQEDANSQG